MYLLTAPNCTLCRPIFPYLRLPLLGRRQNEPLHSFLTLDLFLTNTTKIKYSSSRFCVEGKYLPRQFSCLHAKILALRARQQTTFGAQHRESWCKHRDGGNSKKRSMDFDTLACVTGKKREILVLSVSTTTHDLQHITFSAQSDFWPCRCYLRLKYRVCHKSLYIMKV